MSRDYGLGLKMIHGVEGCFLLFGSNTADAAHSKIKQQSNLMEEKY